MIKNKNQNIEEHNYENVSKPEKCIAILYNIYLSYCPDGLSGFYLTPQIILKEKFDTKILLLGSTHRQMW